MEPRFSKHDPQPLNVPGAASPQGLLRPPLLLALSVQWDDCSVALGNQDAFQQEIWSQQLERHAPVAAEAAGAINASAGRSAAPLASRDALLLLDRLLVRTATPLSAIDRLCFARGPGAFTSLRVAAGLVQGLSLATSIPVVGVCSLGAMAASETAWRETVGSTPGRWLQLAAVDARMGEVYFGLHECRGGHYPVALAGPSVGRPAEAIELFDAVLAQHAAEGAGIEVTLAGNGFRLLPELAAWTSARGLDAEAVASRTATAADVLAVAASRGAPQAGAAATALPVYVRDKIALDVDEQRAGAAARALADTARRGR
jgi:tRNA threonylcarbamoyladenosine biosynthesis protein TsaB